MNRLKILLVEDEDSLREVITLNLDIEGFAVTTAQDGAKALDIAQKQYFDLLIVDVMLPKLNGFELCSQIRKKDANTPILFISARGTSVDKIEGLKLGADDYLAKPFDLEELILRVRSLIKRKPIVPLGDHYNFGANNSISFNAAQASNGSETKELTKLEMKLLKLLIKRTNQVVSREDILTEVWGYDVVPKTRTIDNFILAFRKFFEEDQKKPRHFISTWGIGYKFLP